MLAIGNYLNNGSKQTYGFKLSSIVKVFSTELFILFLHLILNNSF